MKYLFEFLQFNLFRHFNLIQFNSIKFSILKNDLCQKSWGKSHLGEHKQ